MGRRRVPQGEGGLKRPASHSGCRGKRAAHEQPDVQSDSGGALRSPPADPSGWVVELEGKLASLQAQLRRTTDLEDALAVESGKRADLETLLAAERCDFAAQLALERKRSACLADLSQRSP